MSRFVPDIKTQRWVVIAASRRKRPEDTAKKGEEEKKEAQKVCVFCPGNENLTPLELYRFGGMENESAWKVRVIANKYPITDLHEVIVHSPEHEKDIDELSLEQVKYILQTYRQRYNYHVSNNHGQVLIFNNHDVHAGASLTHPHSQLVVLPRQINLDAVPREPLNNIVCETPYFFVYCPDFSQWPYEVWIAPKVMGRTFGTINDEELSEFAELLQKMLKVMVDKFETRGEMHQAGGDKEFPYNYYIYHGEDWYLRIIPRLIHRAGFELGTGLSVNIVDPAIAADEYRKEVG